MDEQRGFRGRRRRYRPQVYAMYAALLAALVFGSALAQAIPPDSLRRVPVQPGDECVVCDTPLNDSDYVFIYKGRRVPVKRDMVDTFLANPDTYFKQMQARGALFHEEAVSEEPIQYVWFIFGAWVALSLLMAGFSAHQAVRKGYPAVRWFFAGLILNFIGLIIIVAKKPAKDVKLPPGMAKVRTTSDPIECPNCGRENHPSADTCSNCGEELTPEKESEASRSRKNNPAPENNNNV